MKLLMACRRFKISFPAKKFISIFQEKRGTCMVSSIASLGNSNHHKPPSNLHHLAYQKIRTKSSGFSQKSTNYVDAFISIIKYTYVAYIRRNDKYKFYFKFTSFALQPTHLLHFLFYVKKILTTTPNTVVYKRLLTNNNVWFVFKPNIYQLELHL